jgi:hypothetical protein
MDKKPQFPSYYPTTTTSVPSRRNPLVASPTRSWVNSNCSELYCLVCFLHACELHNLSLTVTFWICFIKKKHLKKKKNPQWVTAACIFTQIAKIMRNFIFYKYRWTKRTSLFLLRKFQHFYIHAQFTQSQCDCTFRLCLKVFTQSKL